MVEDGVQSFEDCLCAEVELVEDDPVTALHRAEEDTVDPFVPAVLW
jgi:hypothetical protein